MKLTTHYTTQLKASLGVSSEPIEFDAPFNLSQLLALLNERYGDDFRQFALDSDGKLLPSIIVCINDQQVDANDDPELQADCQVTFLSAISGG